MLKNKKPLKKKAKYVVVDKYTKQAHQEGFVARSIFKLQEIDQKVKLYGPGMRILDLGSSPGSWLQFASKKVGKDGIVIGLDISDVRVSDPNVHFFIQDLFEIAEASEKIKQWAPFDIVQSDAMVKTNGIVESDCSKSIQLVEAGIALSKLHLKSGGVFLAKIFEGPGFNEFWNEFRKYFKKSKVFKPESIREGSREIYVMGYRP